MTYSLCVSFDVSLNSHTDTHYFFFLMLNENSLLLVTLLLQRSNNYSKRFRQLHAKQTLLRNVGAYADFMFQVSIYDVSGRLLLNSSFPLWLMLDFFFSSV